MVDHMKSKQKLINSKVCIHFFEPGAIKYVSTLARELVDKNYCNDVVYAISWVETYYQFLSTAECKNQESILMDVGAHEYDGYSNAPLNTEEKILLDELDEKIFDGHIWDFVFDDRHLLYKKLGPAIVSKGRRVGKNRIIRMYIARAKSICDFLEMHDIRTVIYATQDYGTAVGALLGRIASKLGIKVIIPNISKISTRVNVIDDIYAASASLEEEINRLKNNENRSLNEAREYLQDIRKNGLSNYYKSSAYRRRSIQNRIIESVTKLYNQFLIKKSTYRDRHFQRLIGLLLLKFRTIFLTRSSLIGDKFDVLDAKYVYYPLHIEPEINILMLGNGITDQLDVIRRLAKVLPSRTSLVVKEHPLYAGIFPLSFYRELASIPNVVLVSYKTNQNDLIINSELVACISGSTALESATYGIKSIILGKPYFSVCESFTVVNDLSGLKNKVTEALAGEFDDRPLEIFIQAIFNTSEEFDVLNVGRASNLCAQEYLNDEVSKFISLISHQLGKQ